MRDSLGTCWMLGNLPACTQHTHVSSPSRKEETLLEEQRDALLCGAKTRWKSNGFQNFYFISNWKTSPLPGQGSEKTSGVKSKGTSGSRFPHSISCPQFNQPAPNPLKGTPKLWGKPKIRSLASANSTWSTSLPWRDQKLVISVWEQYKQEKNFF